MLKMLKKVSHCMECVVILCFISDSNENASDNKSSAIDVTTIQGVKFLGATGDIKRTKASLLKMLLWDYLKTVRPGS